MSTSKLLTFGAGALVVVALGGLGAKAYMERKVVGEIEEQFASLRGNFAKAEHGPIAVDLWNRKVEVTQINLVPKDAAAETAATIASVTAFGGSSISAGMAADRLEIRDLSVNATTIVEAAARVKYEVPMITVENFVMRRVAPTRATDTIGAVLPLIEALSAKSIAVTQLKSTTTMPAPAKAATNPFAGAIDQTQHNIRVENFANGRIGKATVERMTMAAKMQPTVTGELTVEARNGFATDYDLAGLLAAFASEGANKRAAGPTTLWRTAGIGPISIKTGNLFGMTMAGATMDAVSVDAAKLRPAWLAFKANQPNMARPNVVQQRAFANAMADVYESISFGKIEYRGLAIEGAGMPPWKLDQLALDGYQSGTLTAFTMTGLDGTLLPPKKEAFHLGRFGFKGLKLAQLLRLTGQMNPAMAPAQMSQLYGQLAQSLEGVEISDLAMPDPKSGQPIKVETANMSWGAFVGEMPTAGQFEFKVSIPTAGNTQEPFAMMARNGMRQTDLKYDGKWQWQESTQTLAHAVNFDLVGLGAGSIKLDLNNVTKLVFIAGPIGFSNFAQDMRVGPINVSLRDQGLMKMVAADPVLSAQRQQLVQSLQATAATLPPEQETVRSIVDGISKFLDGPNWRLVLDLKPKTTVSFGQLLAAGKTGPEVMSFLSSQFDVRVVSGAAP